jgi:serpin B
MRRRRLLALSGTLLAGALAGCSAPTPDRAPDRPEPGVEPNLADETVEKLVADANTFSTALFGRLAAEAPEENAIASPLSVSITLSMALAGVRGETRSEMRSALRHSLEGDRLHAAYNALQRELADRRALDPDSLSADYDADDEPLPFDLSIVNAVWGQAGFPFEDEYLDRLSDHYGGGLRELDFRADPNGARTRINDWVAEQTGDRIEELLPRGSIDTLTRLVLTNAVYFRANWQYPFEASDTEPRSFTAIDGTETAVPMMERHEELPAATVDGVEGVELPYVGGEVSMLLVLPPAGEFRDFEADLDAATLTRIVDELEPSPGTVALPRFEFGSGTALRPILEALGMEAAFDPAAADFSGMADLDATDEDLYVDDVYHDATVTVEETGTEAAAATGAVLDFTSAPPTEFEFVADRPFLFAIRDRPTGAVLFLGRVVDAGAAQ